MIRLPLIALLTCLWDWIGCAGPRGEFMGVRIGDAIPTDVDRHETVRRADPLPRDDRKGEVVASQLPSLLQ